MNKFLKINSDFEFVNIDIIEVVQPIYGIVGKKRKIIGSKIFVRTVDGMNNELKSDLTPNRLLNRINSM